MHETGEAEGCNGELWHFTQLLGRTLRCCFSLCVLRDKSPVPACFGTLQLPWRAVWLEELMVSPAPSDPWEQKGAFQHSGAPGCPELCELCLPGSVLQGFSCALAIGTPQLPYSCLPFIIGSSFSCCRAEVSFAAHSAGYVLSFSQGAWETIVFSFLTKSLHSHSRQEVKQFKCLQISFLFSLCPKQPPDVELQKKKQTDFLFVEGGIHVDFFFFYFLGLFSSEMQAGMLWQVAG